MDAAGPLPRSIDGHRHLLLYVDAVGPLLWPYFTSRKSEFVETFRPFVASVGLPELLRCDGARELTQGRFLKLTQELRVRREQTARASPQQNGQCERMIAVLMREPSSLTRGCPTRSGHTQWRAQQQRETSWLSSAAKTRCCRTHCVRYVGHRRRRC